MKPTETEVDEVLVQIAGGVLTRREIAHELEVDPALVSHAVGLLVDRGFVRREGSNRNRTFHATPAGDLAVDQMDEQEVAAEVEQLEVDQVEQLEVDQVEDDQVVEQLEDDRVDLVVEQLEDAPQAVSSIFHNNEAPISAPVERALQHAHRRFGELADRCTKLEAELASVRAERDELRSQQQVDLSESERWLCEELHAMRVSRDGLQAIVDGYREQQDQADPDHARWLTEQGNRLATSLALMEEERDDLRRRLHDSVDAMVGVGEHLLGMLATAHAPREGRP